MLSVLRYAKQCIIQLEIHKMKLVDSEETNLLFICGQ